MDWLLDPQLWIGLVTLTALEIVLGIDNIIFISIISGKLPRAQQPKARRVGLLLALVMRILFLLSIKWLMGLTKPFAHFCSLEITGKSLILLLGGMFLIGKATYEIHERLEGTDEELQTAGAKAGNFWGVVTQIMLLDIVFSIDSVITAVGMVRQIGVMIAAVVISIGIMLWFSGPVSDFVERHPTVKMLALAFLVLIGVNLMAEGFHQHIPRGYTYFAMAFSVGVEMLNIRASKKGKPVKLHASQW